MIIWNFEQKSEAWHEARCGRVTGTRFKSLVAGTGTQTYKDLVTNMACEIITRKQEETYVSADMERGVELEPIARVFYSEITGIDVREMGFISPDDDTPYAEWIGISPDGVLPDKGLLEIKCPKFKTHLEYIEANKLPSEYKYQVQGQLFVTGYDYCDFMSYADGMKPFIYRVFPDYELFKEFEQRLDKLILDVKEKLSIYENYDYLI
jgi:putative phage-type endonuclease